MCQLVAPSTAVAFTTGPLPLQRIARVQGCHPPLQVVRQLAFLHDVAVLGVEQLLLQGRNLGVGLPQLLVDFLCGHQVSPATVIGLMVHCCEYRL